MTDTTIERPEIGVARCYAIEYRDVFGVPDWMNAFVHGATRISVTRHGLDPKGFNLVVTTEDRTTFHLDIFGADVRDLIRAAVDALDD